jgi:3-hydroxy-9,10-secoandrosta-1,3,5(10)-triene-9,17-dione monooxygenase
MRTFLLPRSDYRIEDTWHVSGLQATGSNDIVVEDVLVPAYRTHKLIDGYRCASPGNADNPNPLFKLPFGQVFVRSVSTTIIGICQGMLDAYVQIIKDRISRASGQKAIDDPLAQRVCADAAATIDECSLVLRRNFDEMTARVNAGESISVERRVKYRYDSSRCVERCLAMVDAMFTAAAGSALRLDSPLQRYFQDAHVARAHHANNPMGPNNNYGRVLLGQKNTDFFI